MATIKEIDNLLNGFNNFCSTSSVEDRLEIPVRIISFLFSVRRKLEVVNNTLIDMNEQKVHEMWVKLYAANAEDFSAFEYIIISEMEKCLYNLNFEDWDWQNKLD